MATRCCRSAGRVALAVEVSNASPPSFENPLTGIKRRPRQRPNSSRSKGCAGFFQSFLDSSRRPGGRHPGPTMVGFLDDRVPAPDSLARAGSDGSDARAADARLAAHAGTRPDRRPRGRHGTVHGHATAGRRAVAPRAGVARDMRQRVLRDGRPRRPAVGTLRAVHERRPRAAGPGPTRRDRRGVAHVPATGTRTANCLSGRPTAPHAAPGPRRPGPHALRRRWTPLASATRSTRPAPMRSVRRARHNSRNPR